MNTPSKPSEESIVEFFTRKDNMSLELARSEPGPFKDLADRLSTSMLEYQDELEPLPFGGETVPATPLVEFTHSEKPGRDASGWAHYTSKTGRAAAYTDKIEGLYGPERRIYLGIDPDVSDPEMHRLLVNSDGHLMDMDDTDNNELASNPEFREAFTKAVEVIERSLKQKHEQKVNAELQRVQERRQKFVRAGQVAAGVITVAALGAGVTAGVKEWIIEPRQEAERARDAYDKGDHVLTGETLELDSVTAATMPKSEFDAIPDFSDDDTLLSPRTVNITMNTCKDIDVKPKPGQDLAVAIREGSILVNSRVTATIDQEGYIDLCVTDPGNDSTDDAPIAVQLRNN